MAKKRDSDLKDANNNQNVVPSSWAQWQRSDQMLVMIQKLQQFITTAMARLGLPAAAEFVYDLLFRRRKDDRASMIHAGLVGGTASHALDYDDFAFSNHPSAVLVPVLNLAVPPDSAFHIPDYLVPLLGKYLCFAILALALDLAWGYCGILSLGHGAFFALGGYAMGMYLMRQIGSRGVYANPILPDFMVFLNWKELPWYWYGFDMFWFAAIMVMVVPGLLAFVFGWFAFRSRVTGVYLSIITQALTYALLLAFFRNDMGFGGNNGLTDFKDILGFNIQAQGTREGRGRLLLNGAKEIKMHGQFIPVRAEIASVSGLSAHGDQSDLMRWLGTFRRAPRQTFIVHGEDDGMAGLQTEIETKLGWPTHIPEYLEMFEFQTS